MNDDTIKGRPYTGPAAAVASALEMYGFDEAVTGAGKVRLEVIADFEEKGCVIYKVATYKLVPAKGNESDYGTVSFALRVLADVKGVPGPTYLLAASHEDMDILASAFEGKSPDWVEQWVRNPDSDLSLEAAFAVLTKLVEDE